MVARNRDRFDHVPNNIMIEIRRQVLTAQCPLCHRQPVLITVRRSRDVCDGAGYIAKALCLHCEIAYNMTIEV